MLERMRISDFQCHEQLQIDFDPRLTTLVGPSDSGKSAVMRALRWLAMNRPLGTGFIRRGADDARVDLVFDGGRKVVRQRGESGNRYTLVDDGRLRVFEAFGNDVPDDVGAALRMNVLNFQGQHDAPFWFGLSSGEVARQLNAMMDLDCMDAMLSSLAADLRDARTEASLLAERVLAATQEVDSLVYVPKIDADLRTVEEQQIAADELNARLRKVGTLLAEAKSRESVCRQAAEKAEDFAAIARFGQQVLETRGRCADLAAVVSVAKRCAELVGGERPDLTPVEKAKLEAEKCAAASSKLSRLIQEAAAKRRLLEASAASAAEAEETLAREFGGRCPLCGSVLTGNRTW